MCEGGPKALNKLNKGMILYGAKGLFRVEKFSVYRGRPVTLGCSEIATNAGSEVGRECRSGVFLEAWNNHGSYQRPRKIETDTEWLQPSWPAFQLVLGGGGRPGQ